MALLVARVAHGSAVYLEVSDLASSLHDFLNDHSIGTAPGL